MQQGGAGWRSSTRAGVQERRVDKRQVPPSALTTEPAARPPGCPHPPTCPRAPVYPGLLGFPPKDLQYRFLSLFKPVFYIRQRDYSKVRAGGWAPLCASHDGWLAGWLVSLMMPAAACERQAVRAWRRPPRSRAALPSHPPAHTPSPPPHTRSLWPWPPSSSTTAEPCSGSTPGPGRSCCARTTACMPAWRVSACLALPACSKGGAAARALPLAGCCAASCAGVWAAPPPGRQPVHLNPDLVFCRSTDPTATESLPLAQRTRRGATAWASSRRS